MVNNAHCMHYVVKRFSYLCIGSQRDDISMPATFKLTLLTTLKTVHYVIMAKALE